MIQVVLWKWYQPNMRNGRVYLPAHINTMARMVGRNLRLPHRVICITDDQTGIDSNIECYPLWEDHDNLANATKAYLPSCYRRLKLYDEPTQRELGIKKGDRIIGLDVDTIITGNMDELATTRGDFIGWWMQGGRTGRGVFNGSLQMFNSDGTLQFIWSDFKGNASRIEAANAGFHGSDQSWLSMKLIGRPGSIELKHPTIISYPLQAKIQQRVSPTSVLCFFHGLNKPWDPEIKSEAPWVSNYWRT